MQRTMLRSPRTRAALALGVCGAAAAVGALLGRSALAALDPHAALNATANVVYVGDECAMSRAAVRLVGDGPMVPLPVHPEEVARTSVPCAQAMRHLRSSGSHLWSLVPDAILCPRLVRGARDHLAATLEGNIPAWSLYGAYLGAGMTPEIVDVLQERGLLPPGASLEAALAEAPTPDADLARAAAPTAVGR